ncbi:MAG: chromosomal replication initiator protein DnaA [Myxococcales bacterium]|nr:chromosomal replication initiator protein DnaA [Myxococcales bacterium]
MAMWDDAITDIRGRLSEENFETWLSPIECRKIEGDTLYLAIPNSFYAEWIGSHYLPLILDFLAQRQGGMNYAVEWIVDEKLQQAALTTSSQPVPRAVVSNQAPAKAKTPSGLSPKYAFENFVVGPSNQLAFAACMSAASKSGQHGNPLFIYGGVGLGKTHLVNAVGHRFLERQSAHRVRYLSAECFTNEFIWSLQNGKMDEFRHRYRSECDLLLMDDIQFLAGREQTQEEFFHTFNALYHLDRQIVVTSDVPPKQIPGMQERLISRFQWGLVADIQAPELDTRIAILRTKAEQENIPISNEVALFLAQTIHSNVRELEGTLLRLAVKAELLERTIDLEFAKEALRSVLPCADQATSVEDIQRAACEYFGIKLSDIKSHRRHRAVAIPRMIAMYLSRQRLGTSYPELGDRFGGKDHTTVMSAVRKIASIVDDDTIVREAVQTIERKLRL